MSGRMVDLCVKQVTIHGHRRAYIDTGPRPGAQTLLLLHGIGDDLQTWDTVLADLAQDFRVIAPDFLGHGQSAKPRTDYTIAGFANSMRDLLMLLNVERVTVIGHSLGGGVAMQFAYQYPEHVDRVVLASSGGLGRGVSPVLRLLSLPGSASILAAAELLPARVAVRGLAAFLKHLPGRYFSDIDEFLGIYDHLRAADARSAFLHVLRGVVDAHGQVITMFDRLYLARDLPMLVLWGDRDLFIPVSHSGRASAQLNDVQVKLLHGGGHFPHRDDPAWFNDRLREFISGNPAAQHDREDWRQLLGQGPANADERRTLEGGSDARAV